MFGTHIIYDMQRIAAREALNARPDAPVIADEPRRVRGPRLAGVRLLLTQQLRRAADLVEPAPAPVASMVSLNGEQPCIC
jgi:hypothetical protein